MFFPNRKKRRRTANRAVGSAHTSVETLDDKVLLSAMSMTLKDNGDLLIGGSAAHDDVYVTRVWSTDGSTTVHVLTTATNNDGETFENGQVFGPNEIERVVFYGVGGNDSFKNSTNIPTKAYGGAGNDTLSGGAARDILYGQAGDDDIFAGGGRDGLTADKLYGGFGDDVLVGSDGNDTIYGGGGSDEILAASGDDQIYGDNALWLSNLLGQYDGNDNVIAGRGDDTVYGSGGDDTLFGIEGDDYLSGGDGDDELRGGGENDLIKGGAGSDLLVGGEGADYLEGGDGLDTLQGEGGNDVLDPGHDDFEDVMNGGSGADTFVWHSNIWGTNVEDFWEDYDGSIDEIFVNWVWWQ